MITNAFDHFDVENIYHLILKFDILPLSSWFNGYS